MGLFTDRIEIERFLETFAATFSNAYDDIARQKHPILASKLPFLKQGVHCIIAYGTYPYLIMVTDSSRPAYSFCSGDCVHGTWDESEYTDLAMADCVEDIISILDIEENILYSMKLESLEKEYLENALGQNHAKKLAEQLLAKNVRTLTPTFEGEVFRMKQAYELLFRLENRLRKLIEKKLIEKYGNNDWWIKGVTGDAKKHYERCQRDNRTKWHKISKQISPINYVEFVDLHDIIVNKNSDLFKECIGPLDRFSANMKSLELPRNYIAHNNVMPAGEFQIFRNTVGTLLQVIETNID